jgi:RNA polymerase sigma factor (sigma-70 family)
MPLADLPPADNNLVSPECLYSLQNGDKTAFKEVFELYFKLVTFYAGRFLGQDPFVEDIAQETLTKAWKKRAEFETPQHLKGFLYTTTHNACLNYLRKSHNQGKTDAEWARHWVENNNEDPDVLKLYTEAVSRLSNTLGEIPGGQVLYMHYIEKKTTDQIAQELNMTPGNIYTIKCRALQFLRENFHLDLIILFLLWLFRNRP